MLRLNKQKIINNKKTKIKKGQVILEFTFCMIIVLLMIYGLVKIVFWSGRDLVERRKAHEKMLTGNCFFKVNICTRMFRPPGGCMRCVGSAEQQIDPYFYTPIKMNAIWRGKYNL